MPASPSLARKKAGKQPSRKRRHISTPTKPADNTDYPCSLISGPENIESGDVPSAATPSCSTAYATKQELVDIRNKLCELENNIAPLQCLTPLLNPNATVDVTTLLKAASLINTLSSEVIHRLR